MELQARSSLLKGNQKDKLPPTFAQGLYLCCCTIS
uniref:Uncharacterized protein n=1 Tax=Arundo donax TaxID=35708 RepID=A0A0A9APR5_ARUDO